MPGYFTLDFETSIQYETIQVPLKGKKNKGKFKTVRREGLHGPSWKSPKNDIYSIIYGSHPDRINMLHSKRGFKRKLPFRVGKMLLKSHTMIGTNLKFDLGYIWHDKYFQKWLAQGGKIWDCFRGDTEILTEKGFQKLDELDKTIKVAQYNKDGSISFTFPLAYIENHFDGELVHIHGPKGVNHISTPNHNRVIRKQKKLNKISLVTADSTSALAKGNKSVISGLLNNEQECDFTDDELRFIVAMQADAYINKQGYASFELSKSRKQERLEDILKSIGLDYKLYTYRNKIYHVRGIDKYLGESKHFDIIDPLKMSLRQRLLFINELNFWDGEPKYCNKKGMIYHNLNEQALDKVRLLCALSKCRVHKSKNGKSLWITRDCDDLQNSMISKSYIKHTGKVYCVNVPSNMIIIRQGKDIQVSGNCQIAAYLLGGQRWQYPSLGEMQSVILGRKTKLDSITRLFKRMIGANEIIARRNERKFWFKAYKYYGNEDGRSPMLIMQKQHKEAKAKGMLTIIELYNKYLLALTMMEVNGIPVDIPAVEKLYQEFSLEVVKYLEKATLIVKPFWTDPDLPSLNINSPAQSSLLLFGGDIKVKRKVATGEFVKSGKNKGKEKTKTVQEMVHIKGFGLNGTKFSRETTIAGRYSTDKGVIETIYEKCTDEQVIEYCKNLKLSATYKQKISTYLNAMLFKSVDGIIRANYNNTETRTSRLSASLPNLQNIPAHGEFGASIPALLIAPKGWTCCSIDFSQLEVLCQAMLSKDWNLCRDIRNGIDFHVKRLCYVEPEFTYDQICQLAKVLKQGDWPEKRSKAKVISFQKAYGAAAESLSRITGLAFELIKEIFEKEDLEYPQVKEFDENLSKEVQNSAILSRKYHYAIKATKGQDSKGVPRKFMGTVELLPIRERDRKTYTFIGNEYRHVGFYKSPTGKRYSFLEYGSRKKDGGIFRYYKPTQMKNYPMQGTAGDIQAITTVAMFPLLLKHQDKVKLVNEIHDSKWFLIKNEYLDRILSKLCYIMRSTSQLLQKQFNIKIDFDFDVEAKIGTNFADMEIYKE